MKNFSEKNRFKVEAMNAVASFYTFMECKISGVNGLRFRMMFEADNTVKHL